MLEKNETKQNPLKTRLRKLSYVVTALSCISGVAATDAVMSDTSKYNKAVRVCLGQEEIETVELLKSDLEKRKESAQRFYTEWNVVQSNNTTDKLAVCMANLEESKQNHTNLFHKVTDKNNKLSICLNNIEAREKDPIPRIALGYWETWRTRLGLNK